MQHTMTLPVNHPSIGGRYIGNQSIDSTYDVEGNETYRGHGFISDDSDLSDESSDEEQISIHRNCQRQPVKIYDADEGGMVEINRSSDSSSGSSTEPEPVDVFEQDKLKYINSFRTNDVRNASTVGGATPSSKGSNDQDNLMERLVQINMAAEATYLMAKYNSNIQGNASR
ncbi:Hypothetical protein PHPALM_16216 [Phytophthora palmivora]|uniref:Uncharacterized protein n=1 Tax=Phytophthora palmivora TaxID=4796 RepID=A0A2P4XQ95_9STRA|nr:Hypothetical protein PHPALM_16216 [Phytophthora palmivora]